MSTQIMLFNENPKFTITTIEGNGREFQRIQQSRLRENTLEGLSASQQNHSAIQLFSSVLLLAIEDLTRYLAKPSNKREQAGEHFINFISALQFIFSPREPIEPMLNAYCSILDLDYQVVRFKLVAIYPELTDYIERFVGQKKTH